MDSPHLQFKIEGFVRRAHWLIRDRHDGRLFVCGFSQGAYAAIEYVAARPKKVTAWVAVDAYRDNSDPLEPKDREAAQRVSHLLVAGPLGLHEHFEEERPIKHLSPKVVGLDTREKHRRVAREVFRGDWKVDWEEPVVGVGSIYDWMLR